MRRVTQATVQVTCFPHISPLTLHAKAEPVILALSGSTLSTFLVSTLLRKGKPSFADMANAALAGGVAVGATCNLVSPAGAFAIGLLVGTLCVVGYALIQPRLDTTLKIVDTCGVHNLHGMPGLLGGLTAALVVPGIAKAQLVGIAFTMVFAFGAGTAAGYVIKLAGAKATAYEDDEFVGLAPAPGDSQDDEALVTASSPLA